MPLFRLEILGPISRSGHPFDGIPYRRTVSSADGIFSRSLCWWIPA